MQRYDLVACCDDRGMCADEEGEFVKATDAIERERVLREALFMARKYVVSHSPAALVSEVKQIDAALAQ